MFNQVQQKKSDVDKKQKSQWECEKKKNIPSLLQTQGS